jgi:ASPIC and UnbV/FG-GAP-like repeat
MAEFLRDWDRQAGSRNPFGESGRVKTLEEVLARETNAMNRVNGLAELAKQFLNVGRVEESLGVVTNLLRTAESLGVNLRAGDRAWIRQLEGLAWLRLGERNNCLKHHNPYSCLAPIQPQGAHVERTGAEKARAIFLELAQRDTNDLTSRWLLNIAAMTLGEYPKAVPGPLLVAPSVFDSEYALKRFPEVATGLGLGVDDVSGGTVVEDFDGDGLLDVAFSAWLVGRQMRLFRNLGDGRFQERTAQAGLTGLTGGLNMIQTDYNNDGWPDLHVIRGAWLGDLGQLPDSLLKNNGDGTFADVTEEAGLLSFHPKLSAVWFDANKDGWLDLFIGCETQPGKGRPHPTQLFLNRGNGRFAEGAGAAGVAVVGFVRGVVAGDFDNDGWPDLYISMLDQPNRLFRNEGKASSATSVHFTDVTASAGVGEPKSSFPCWFWDYDNDGWLDLFACGYSADYGTPAAMNEYVADRLGLPSTMDRPRLYRNNRDGTFADTTRASGLYRVFLAMGANFGELDNDGFLDFYLGTGAPSFASLTPNEMFRNEAGRRFQNVTGAGGFGHLQKGHAIAFGDLNNDGQQEVIANIGGAYPGDSYFNAVFANPGHSNRWVCLKLIGKSANRAAIGARIKVVASGRGGKREIHRVVGSGGSFGASPLRQEIGLGDTEAIDFIEVRWPVADKTTRFTNLLPDRFYELSEDATAPRPLQPRTFSWSSISRGAHTHHH